VPSVGVTLDGTAEWLKGHQHIDVIRMMIMGAKFIKGKGV